MAYSNQAKTIQTFFKWTQNCRLKKKFSIEKSERDGERESKMDNLINRSCLFTQREKKTKLNGIKKN